MSVMKTDLRIAGEKAEIKKAVVGAFYCVKLQAVFFDERGFINFVPGDNTAVDEKFGVVMKTLDLFCLLRGK